MDVEFALTNKSPAIGFSDHGHFKRRFKEEGAIVLKGLALRDMQGPSQVRF